MVSTFCADYVQIVDFTMDRKKQYGQKLPQIGRIHENGLLISPPPIQFMNQKGDHKLMLHYDSQSASPDQCYGPILQINK